MLCILKYVHFFKENNIGVKKLHFHFFIFLFYTCRRLITIVHTRRFGMVETIH